MRKGKAAAPALTEDTCNRFSSVHATSGTHSRWCSADGRTRLTPGLGGLIYQHTGGSAPQGPDEGSGPSPLCPSVRPARGGACAPGAAGAAGGGGPVPHITLPRSRRLPIASRSACPRRSVPWLGASARPAESREPPRPAGTQPAVTPRPAPACCPPPAAPSRSARRSAARGRTLSCPSVHKARLIPSLAAIAPSRLLPRGRAGSHAVLRRRCPRRGCGCRC